MLERVFFTWLAIIKLVASNPVPQAFSTQYASQPIPYYENYASIPSSYQVGSQNSPYTTQHNTIQQPTPAYGNVDGTAPNKLLMSKILSNPCLKKILDPSTKLYNQNGREIQRQPNTGPAPSVINNYFIVPPEFFNLNNNKTQTKFTNKPKRRKYGNRKSRLTKAKTKSNVFEGNKNAKVLNETKNNGTENNNDRITNKNNQKLKSAKIVYNDVDLDQDSINSEQAVKKSKKRKSKELSKNADSIVEISTPNEDFKIDSYKQEKDKGPVENNTGKRRKKSKKKSIVTKKEPKNNIHVPELNEVQENYPPKSQIVKSLSYDKQTETNIKSEEGSHLKNIESPVDNNETISLQENTRPVKRMKENGKSKNPSIHKTDKANKETNKQAQSTPMPNDILKNFFPYMYMGNNFYSNGNYPFNFEQFYQPQQSQRNNNKVRKSQQNKKDVLPSTLEVKKKPNNPQNTTIQNSLQKENENEPELHSEVLTTTVKPFDEIKLDEFEVHTISTNSNTESIEHITGAPTKDRYDELSLVALKAEDRRSKYFPEPLKQDIPEIKANPESTSTVIEDLQKYIIPDLESEDVVPTVRTNDVINDYYPVFNEDSFYTRDESYYLRDLEDDRDFYTTDRSFHEPLNRDRINYEMYENYPISNLDIKDRINFRRTYKFKERDKSNFFVNDKINMERPYSEKNIEIINNKHDTYDEKEHLEQNNNLDDQFQTPPLLESPDFITTKIEKGSLKSDIDSYGSREAVFTNTVEKVPDVKNYFGKSQMQYNKLMNFDNDGTNADQYSTNKPRSDRIETVFAKTRVVKYGVAKDETESTSPLPLLDNDVEDFYSDGKTAYVLAKSVGHSDDFFW